MEKNKMLPVQKCYCRNNFYHQHQQFSNMEYALFWDSILATIQWWSSVVVQTITGIWQAHVSHQMLRYLSNSTPQICTAQWPSSMPVYKYYWKQTENRRKKQLCMANWDEDEIQMADWNHRAHYQTVFLALERNQPFHFIIIADTPLINNVK